MKQQIEPINIEINEESCIRCGACAEECSLGIITWKSGEVPKVAKPENCFKCGRCMARCAKGALTVGSYSPDNFRSISTSDKIDPDIMETFLLSKRSCRKYLEKPIEKDILERLLKVAQMAPTAMNSEEKSYIVIQDSETSEKLRIAMQKHTKGLLSLMKLFTRKPFTALFPKDSIAGFNKMQVELNYLLKHYKNGFDPFFFNAPCLILFTGVGMDLMGKDNALGAMHYFMLMAESMGLGSCISGFLQSAPGKVAKIVEISKHYKVYGAIMLGYPAAPFSKTVFRNEPEVNWVMNPEA